MPLLVVPLAPEHLGRLTLDEYDRLLASERVLFEDPSHPLAGRLRDAGVEATPIEDEPEPARDGWALVADPSSSRVPELAHGGAEVTAGVATPPDSLTAARGAPGLREASSALTHAVLIMARLRSEEGCPWDLEQTHESLKLHLLEESYEVIDAIDRSEVGAELEEELGDVLLQVLFHARLAEQDGRFDIAGVAGVLVAKLIRRHPHVFGDAAADSAGEVVANWERIKQREKNRSGPFDGIPAALPALVTAHKVQKRAASLGFDGEPQRARAELLAAVDGDLMDPENLGRALFWLVALARGAGVDPETALRTATTHFKASLETP